MKKRGVSSLISTLLIILATVLIGTAILIWAVGYVKSAQQSTSEISEETVFCASTDIKIRTACIEDDDIVFMVENPSQTDLEGLNIRVIGSSGAYQEIIKEKFKVAEIRKIIVNNDGSIGSLRYVELLPIIFAGKEITCSQAASESNIKPC